MSETDYRCNRCEEPTTYEDLEAGLCPFCVADDEQESERERLEELKTDMDRHEERHGM